MNSEVKKLLDSIGALAELCGEFKRSLIANGFTGAEAMPLVQTLVMTTLAPKPKFRDTEDD